MFQNSVSQLPEKIENQVANRTVSNDLHSFILTRLKFNELSFNSNIKKYVFNNISNGYVAFACSDPNENNRDILLIREDVVLRSNLMSSLVSARSPYDLGEVLFLKNPNANLKNMITYCNWIDQHIQYNNLNSEDKLRDNFDKTFFLNRDYKELMQLMNLGVFLELHPNDWHVKKQKEQIKLTDKELDENEEIPVLPQEICASILGDMMASCDTPIQLQKMFPDLIGDEVLTTKDKYNIIVNDAWIHGDNGVQVLLNNLQMNSKEKIPVWNANNEDRIRILKEFGLEPDAKIETIKIEGQNDTGIKAGANWWG